MEIIYHRVFLKKFEKTPSKIQQKFKKQLVLFTADPFYGLLDNHALTGRWQGFRSIDITGDWRAVFEETDYNTVEFYTIGTHSQLYK